MVEDDRASVQELATLVGHDPALSARFLTVANSPALKCATEIRTLERCMIVLGTRLARTLATCLAIQRVFDGISNNSGYNFTGFWGHSLRVAELAREIATRLNRCDVEDAYLAGLLHDVGQLLLLGGLKDRYGDILRLSLNESVLYALEGPMLDTDHAMVAAWLVDQWKLTSFIPDAVLFHHASPEEIVDADFLSQIIWSSHAIASHNEKIDPEKKIHLPELSAVTSMLGLDLEELGNLHRVSHERVVLLADALGISQAEEIRTLPAAYAPLERRRPLADTDDPAYADLENTVRELALMQSLLSTLSAYDSEAELLVAVREAAQILFGLAKLSILLVHPDQPLLVSPDVAGQPPLLRHLQIRLDPPYSLAASVVAGQGTSSTFDPELKQGISLVDIQISRVLDCEGLVYVPLVSRNGCIGLMVYGLSASRFARIGTRIDWMTRFARLAADALQSWRENRRHDQNIESELASRFEQRARQVVHEAGNPLGIIKNYLSIISRRLPDGNIVSQELEILREEIDRVALIVRRLNDITGSPPKAEPVDINGVIRGMMAIYGESLFSVQGIGVEMTLDPSLPAIRGDRDGLKQILLNLWKNSSEAMQDGGSLSISTNGNVPVNGRNHVEILLADSGPGLPPDVLEHLFQPLEPERRPGHAGIGLSIVASLVEKLDGQITCQSGPGQGTSFIIRLPRIEAVEQ